MWKWGWKTDSRRITIAVTGLVLLGAAGSAFVAAVLLFFNGDAAQPPILDAAQTTNTLPLTVSITPDSRIEIDPAGGRIVFAVEPGSVQAPVELTLTERSPRLSPRLPKGFSRALRVFEVTGMQGQRAWSGPFARPVSVTMPIDQEALRLAQGDPSRVVVLHLEDVGRGWKALESSLSYDNREVWARSRSLSLFALAIKEPDPAPELPGQPRLPIRSFPNATLSPVPTVIPTNTPAPTSTPSPTATAEPTLALPTPMPAPANPSPADAPAASATPSEAAAPVPTAIPTPIPAPAIRPATPIPRPTATPAPTPTREPGWRLFLNGRQVTRDTLEIEVHGGLVYMYQLPYEDGRYRRGSRVGFSAVTKKPNHSVTIDGADSAYGNEGRVYMNRDRHVIVRIEPPREPHVAASGPVTSASKSTSGNGSGSGSQLLDPAADRPEFPNPHRIVFHSDRDGDYDLYAMASDGSVQTAITNNDFDDRDPSITADGSRMVFVSTRDGNPEIYVQDGLWATPVRLTESESADLTPSMSPSGDRIAFVSERDGNREIYAMDADGANLTRLTINRSQDIDPSWSPDGESIIFAREVDGSLQLFTMTADGFEQTRLTDGEWNDRWPRWSADSDDIGRILFASDRPTPGSTDTDWEVWIWYFDGTDPAPSTSNPGAEVASAWAPSGDEFLFESDRDGNAEIYWGNNPFGGNLANLTNSPDSNEGSPSWALLE